MRLPLVTIVGRPNVGKSTLFNRILKKRKAIVDDRPGVTRDRHYATADWAGRAFVLVDTGGYLPKTANQMELAIREQVEIAIGESDLLLFVVDRSTGITDIDQVIAEKLQRSGKPILLAVNKTDNALMESEGYQFFKLGLGEPLLVSALQGRSIGDLLDRLVENLTEPDRQIPRQDEIKLAVIGKENVGKSSFVNTLIGQERVIVTPIPGTTRDPIDTPLTYKKRQLLLIDTAGLKRRAKVKENVLFYSHLRTMKSIQRADVVVCFVDATAGLTRQDMRILGEIAAAKKPMALALNKWDLVPKDEKTLHQWEKAIRESLGPLNFVPLVFTSVLKKQRLYHLLDVVLDIYEEYHKQIKTSDLNNIFQPIIEKTTPPAVKGKEIKLKYVTQVHSAPPVFAFFSNHPELITVNYRRFLEKQIRLHWGFRGVPITVTFKSKQKKQRTPFPQIT